MKKGEQNEPAMMGLIMKMQQQLAFLETKIDTLIAKTSERPFQVKHDSKPFQRFDHSHHQREARQDNNYRERVLHKAICADCNKECQVPFKPSQDRAVYCKDCFSKRKVGSSFNGKADNAPRHADKPHGDGKKKFPAKKRPAGKRRKARA